MTEKSIANPELNLQKSLGTDKIFKFECNVEEGKIRLVLKQTNINTSNQYEANFTLKELCQINRVFKSCNSLEEVQAHLLIMFKRDSTLLKSLEDDKKIEISFKVCLLSNEENLKLILDRKPQKIY